MEEYNPLDLEEVFLNSDVKLDSKKYLIENKLIDYESNEVEELEDSFEELLDGDFNESF
jgi:hypothetical protein